MSQALGGYGADHGSAGTIGGGGGAPGQGIPGSPHQPADPTGYPQNPPGWANVWRIPVIFGALSVVLGVMVLVWPGHTIGALAVMFGFFLLIIGAYRFAHAFHLRGDTGSRAVAVILGTLAVLLGIVCLIDPFTTASVFAIVVGAFWMVAGIITIFAGLRRKDRTGAGRAATILIGVCNVLIGLLIEFFPVLGLLFMALLLGCYLVFIGITAIMTGLAVRRMLKDARTSALYWT